MPVVNAAPFVASPTGVGQTTSTPSSSTLPIDYSSRDYASILADLTAQIPNYLPEWTSRSASDFGMVLLQLFAWMGDQLNYYIDRIANEAFLSTATQPQSVLNIASMLDYQPVGSVASTVTLGFTLNANQGTAVTIPAGTQVATLGTPTQSPIIFETTADLTITPPTLSGTVTASQGVTVTGEAVGTSNGTPNQSFSLGYHPVIDDSLSIYVDEGFGPLAWRFTQHLIDYGPQDRVFSMFTDFSGVVHVEFGDNANGRIPANGSPITATYRVGVGSVGNVGPSTLVQMVRPIAGVASVTNNLGATGGSDPQSLDSIREQVPSSIRAAGRAVTVTDFKSLVLQVSGVQHASAQMQTYQLVNLYIAPFGGGAPSASLMQAVQNYLADKVLVNTTVLVQTPTYVPVNITVSVQVLPQFGATAIQNAVGNALLNLLTLDAVDFGFRVSVASVYSAILAVEGVQYANLTLMARNDLTQSGVADAVMVASEIPTAGTLIVNVTGGMAGS